MIFTMFSLGSSLSFAEPATSAGEDKAQKGPISLILGDLSWGATETEVLNDAKMRLEKDWASQRKNLDTLGMDQLRRKKREEFKTIKNSLARFDLQKTGFESSVVGHEYQMGKNESLLVQKVMGQSRYYFFRDRSLWKIVVVMDASRSKSLTGFVREVGREFGRSASRTFRNEAGQKKLDTVTWKGPDTIATAIDQRGVFNAFLVRFVQVGRGEAIQLELDKRPKKKVAEDDMLTDLFEAEDRGATQAEPSLVDELTGESHELDLNRGVIQERRD